MKHEWRKTEKYLYLPPERPELIDVPEFSFITIDGAGDPNGPTFGEKIGALYSIAYAIKMMPRSGFVPEGYFEYTVYPLEGVYTVETYVEGEPIDKNDLIYTLMIRQPDFVNDDVFAQAVDAVRAKKPSPHLDHITLKKIEEDLCVQMMHIGPYDDELATFNKMVEYCENNDLARISGWHREIYLSDPSKVDPSKMKTALRFQVERV